MRVHGHGLSIAFVWHGDLVTLFLRGHLDRRSAPLLADALHAVGAQHAGRVWVDVAGIERIDAAGAQALLDAGRRGADGAGEFLIRSPSTTVGRALERVWS